jgi:hypothetical protein
MPLAARPLPFGSVRVSRPQRSALATRSRAACWPSARVGQLGTFRLAAVTAFMCVLGPRSALAAPSLLVSISSAMSSPPSVPP